MTTQDVLRRIVEVEETMRERRAHAEQEAARAPQEALRRDGPERPKPA